MTVYATADTSYCIPADNLPTTCKHYATYINLCLTAMDTLETCCNLPTATDLQLFGMLPVTAEKTKP